MADRSRRSSRIGQRQALAASLLISAIVHALVLMLPLELDHPGHRRRRAGSPARAPASSPLEVVNISAPHARRAPAREPRIRPPLFEDTVVPESPGPSTAAGSEVVPLSEASAATERGPSGESAASLLRPPPPDPRLWGGVHPTPPTAGPWTLGERIAAYNRRMSGVSIPPGGDMNVWTVRDGEDNRWGFSPGAIHLGAFVMPLCAGDFDAANCGFGVPPGFREDYRFQLRQRLEIAGQVRHGEVLDRARAIRARRDALRDSIARRRR